MSDAARRYALAYAKHMIDYIPPCPWNPFPLTSQWGQAVETAWQRNERKRRQRSKP